MIWILVALIVVAICLLSWHFDSQQRARFSVRFSPLSDDEFVERCGPGTNRDIALKVRAIISEQLCIPVAEIYPEHRFIEDLHAD